MRKVTARELYRMGVKGGPDIPLSDHDKVELAKAKILRELETTHGSDYDLWLRILKRAEKRILEEPHYTAIKQLIAELEAKVKNGY